VTMPKQPFHPTQRGARRTTRSTERGTARGITLPSSTMACATVLAAAVLASACSSGVLPLPTGGQGGMGANGGAGGAAGQGGQGGEPLPPFEPAQAGMRRLISRQFYGSLEVLLGPAAAAAAAAPMDPKAANLQTVGAASLAHEPESMETYEGGIRAAAQSAVFDPAVKASILSCVPTAPDDAVCLDTFVREFGRLAWRRPLEDDEAARIVGVAQLGAQKLGSFEKGLETAISTLLNSPHFLYIVEVGEEDPAKPGQFRLSPYELASRLSFFLLDRTPSDALLDLAESGGLDTPEGLRAQAQAMLQDPKARDTVLSFYTEIFRLDELESKAGKDASLFPTYDALKDDFKEETLRFVEDIVFTRDADAREIVTADFTFVNPDLAAHYGVPAPASGTWEKVTLPPEQKRAGLLGQASFLARFSHPDGTSPTRRGVFVRQELLCGKIDPPPPSVNPILPPEDPNTPKTQKDKLTIHQEEPSCAGCHSLIDPIGLALENYNAIGAYQTTDSGLPIDTAGSSPNLGSFASARELATLLQDDPRTVDCMLRYVYRNSMGHIETEGESEPLAALSAAFEASGYSIQSLIVELVTSDGFRYVGLPQ
jgi:hypothetical protein